MKFTTVIVTIVMTVTALKLKFVEGDPNYTSLMREYLLLCGPEYFCFESSQTYKWEIGNSDNFRNQRLCPECRCDKSCVNRGDCCPDLFFSFPKLECVNRTIIKATENDRKRDSQFSALMVTDCPTGSDPDVSMKCTNLTDTKSRLLNFPVTAVEFPIHYYNRHCAKCNNVTEFKTWKLDIFCGLMADFNYLSSVEDVISMAFEKKCYFQTFKEDNITEKKEKNCFDITENKRLYTKCNETGEWVYYNSDVRYACESSYKRTFRIFKNVFCYMCNPSGQSYFGRVVDKCNETGQWRTVDGSMERDCQDLPASRYTLPFKNIFCYMCNKVYGTTRKLVDGIGFVLEDVVRHKNFRFRYAIHISEFDLDYLQIIVNRTISKHQYLNKTTVTPFSMTSVRNKHGSFINLTSLLAFNAALEGYVNVCKGRHFQLTHSNSNCNCDLTCVFDNSRSCCADLALEISAKCVSDFELSGTSNIPYKTKPYLVIDGCLGERRLNLFEKECREPLTRSIYTMIPVSDNRGLSFKNLYCVLCNLGSQPYLSKMNGKTNFTSHFVESKVENSNVLQMHVKKYSRDAHKYKPLELKLNCPFYLDYSHLLTIDNILGLAQYLQCRVQFKFYGDYSETCLNVNHKKCSDSLNWTYLDNNVEWACNEATLYSDYFPEMPISLASSDSYTDTSPEKIYRRSHYSNIYCALCRPVRNFTTYIIDKCPQGVQDNGCVDLPQIFFYYPYKNKACAECHGVKMNNAPYSIGKQRNEHRFVLIVSSTWFPILRNLFSFAQTDDVSGPISQMNCSGNEVFDKIKNSCRVVRCYEGKYFNGTMCIPFLPLTQNLRYFMRIRADIFSYGGLQKKDTLETALSIISKEIVGPLNHYSGFISPTPFEKSFNCSDDTGPCVLTVYIALEIFIQSSVDRHGIEMFLLQFSNNRSLNGLGPVSSILISHLSSEDADEHFTPIMNQYRRLVDNDEVKSSSETYQRVNGANTGHGAQYAERSFASLTSSFFISMISEVLLCRQIELDDDEFDNIENKSTLFLSRLNLEIESNKYTLSPRKGIRICYDYLNEIGYFTSIEGNDETNSSKNTIDFRTIWIVSMVCIIVSALSLCMSLVIYCLLPSLRTTSGKLMMLMMTSLLFTLVFFQLSSFMVLSRVGCLSAGFILHFSWLSVFFSMNVCNYRSFIAFVSKSLKPPMPKSKAVNKELLCGIIYTFGMSLLCVGINVTVSSFIKGSFTSGYGGSHCFIDNMISNIISFISPAIIVLISNVVFFTFTVRAIRRAPNVRSNRQQRNEFAICLRLTTVTGGSWLLQIVDFFLPLSVFSYIATSIILLQGLFIFLAFSAKRRNLKLLYQTVRSRNDKPDHVPKEMKPLKTANEIN